MPGLLTHYICGNAVVCAVDTEIRNILEQNRHLYNIGAQGPDIFFYYLPGLIRKRTRTLGGQMHSGGFRDFFEHMCKQISGTANIADKNASFAYLCGYLTHYALDCAAHPYIYYKSGFRRAGEPVKSLKYTVYHRNLETAIDVLMLKLMSDEKPCDKKIWQLVHVSKGESVYVSRLLSNSIAHAYNIDITDKQIFNAMSYMARATRILQSRNGRKKRFFELLEDSTIGERNLSSIIHPNELTDSYDYLNLLKKPWALPWDDKIQHTLSFTELFDKAVCDAQTMITALSSFLNGSTTLAELAIIAGNYSFASGIDSSENIVFSFHDIIFEK